MKIAVLTLNPGVDRVIYLPYPTACGSLNRASRVVMSQGSKGANVALMLSALGAKVDHISFGGGVFGQLCESYLSDGGVRSLTRPCACGVRMNVKVIDSDGLCTEFNERGGPVTEPELDSLLSLIHTDYDVIFLTGSLPSGVPTDTYSRVVASHRDHAIVVVDCDGEAMLRALSAHPALIKPNRRELAGIVGCAESELGSDETVFMAARGVHEKYGCDVICTLDADGSIYVGDDGEYHVDAVPVKLRGFSGAGDTYLATYAFKKYVCHSTTTESLACASSAASAKVALEGTKLPHPDDILTLPHPNITKHTP